METPCCRIRVHLNTFQDPVTPSTLPSLARRESLTRPWLAETGSPGQGLIPSSLTTVVMRLESLEYEMVASAPGR